MLLQIILLYSPNSLWQTKFKNFCGRDASVNTFNTLLQFHTDIPLILLFMY